MRTAIFRCLAGLLAAICISVIATGGLSSMSFREQVSFYLTTGVFFLFAVFGQGLAESFVSHLFGINQQPSNSDSHED